jgi:hypothetical protein
MVNRGRRAFVLALAAGVPACVDSLDQQTSRIDGPRILAVIPTPAEAAPRATIDYTAVVATPDGPLAAAPLTWAHCVAPKPPTEDNVVAPPCLDDPFELIPLGTGLAVTATMPEDACARFGPDTPPGGFRPRDPDASGGYYQPVRTELPDTAAPIAFGLHRIACNLGDAPPAIVREYRDRYLANEHPTIAAFTVSRGGVPLDPARDAVAPGEALVLAVEWPAGAAEPYVSYDRRAVAIVERRESLRVGWFATAGALAADATGVADTDPATTTSVTWFAPEQGSATAAHLWAVLHDDRGGVAVGYLTIAVGP